MMDDDARPEIGALEQFHSIDRSTHDAWVTAVRYPSGGICDMNRPWINPFWSMGGFLKGLSGGRGGFHIKDSAYEEPAPMEIDGGSFVGLFWSRGALKKAGLPQGRLFLYGDDVLYCLALRRAGGRVAFDPALRFLHDCETFEESDGTIAPLWKVYYMRPQSSDGVSPGSGAVFLACLCGVCSAVVDTGAALRGAGPRPIAGCSKRGAAGRCGAAHGAVIGRGAKAGGPRPVKLALNSQPNVKSMLLGSGNLM